MKFIICEMKNESLFSCKNEEIYVFFISNILISDIDPGFYLLTNYYRVTYTFNFKKTT